MILSKPTLPDLNLENTGYRILHMETGLWKLQMTVRPMDAARVYMECVRGLEHHVLNQVTNRFCPNILL